SQRYIPARQLPDKAVSLLDAAAARVAISQSTTPAMIRDAVASIAAREAETAGLLGDGDFRADKGERVAAIAAEIATLKAALADLESEWATEQKLVDEIRELRGIPHPPPQ